MAKRKLKKKKEEKEPTYNLPWVTNQLEGFEERTVRNYFRKVISLLGKTEDDFKDAQGKICFDKELADYIVFTFKQIDKPFLRKTLENTNDITPDEAFEYQQATLEYIETIKEPAKSEYRKLYESLAISRSQALFKRTLENVKELADLFGEIPVEDQINLLEKLNPVMEKWKLEIKKEHSLNH